MLQIVIVVWSLRSSRSWIVPSKIFSIHCLIACVGVLQFGNFFWREGGMTYAFDFMAEFSTVEKDAKDMSE